jgi:hypothetical protein
MINSCTTTYEINKCQDPCAKSLKISQLKSQLVQLEEDDKAYNDLLQKYRQLQNEYQLINETKLHLEYELKQKNETTNKILNDLKNQNIDLNNELNEKIIFTKNCMLIILIYSEIWKIVKRRMKIYVKLLLKMKR